MDKKIYIIGNLGSGKSYLSKELSKILNISYFELDDLFWKKKYTEKHSDEEMKQIISNIISNNKSWIMEGAFVSFIDEAIQNADEVVLLDLNVDLVYLKRVIIRELGKVKKSEKTLRDVLKFIGFVRSYKKKCGFYDQHQVVLNKHKVNLVTINNRKEFKQYLEQFNPILN